MDYTAEDLGYFVKELERDFVAKTGADELVVARLRATWRNKLQAFCDDGLMPADTLPRFEAELRRPR